MPPSTKPTKKRSSVRSPKKKAGKSPSVVTVSAEKESLSPGGPTFYTLMVDDRLRQASRSLRKLYRAAYGGDPRTQHFRDTDWVLLEFGDCAEIEAYEQKLSEYARRMAEIEPCDATESNKYAGTCLLGLKEMGLPVDTELKRVLHEVRDNGSEANDNACRLPCWGPYTRVLFLGTSCLLFLTQLLRKMFFRHIDLIADTPHSEYSIPSTIADAADVYVQTSNSLKVVRCSMIPTDGFKRIQHAHEALLEFLEKIAACKTNARACTVVLRESTSKNLEITINGGKVDAESQSGKTLLVLALFRKKEMFSIIDFQSEYKGAGAGGVPAGLFWNCINCVKRHPSYLQSPEHLQTPICVSLGHNNRKIHGLVFDIQDELSDARIRNCLKDFQSGAVG